MKGQGAGLRARLTKKRSDRSKPSYSPTTKVNYVENIVDSDIRYKGFWGNVRDSIHINSNSSSSINHSKINAKNRLNDTSSVREADIKTFLLINPNDRWKINWDLFLGALIVYSIIVIPFRIGFEVEISTASAINFEYFLDAIFFTDLILTFNTPYRDDFTDNLVLDRRKIAFNYAKFWLWIDLFSSVPFDNIFSAAMSRNGSLNSIRLVRVLRLLRLLKLFRVFKLSKIDDHADRVNINPALIGVCQLLFQIFFLAHLICCFWHYLTTSDVTDSTWNKSSEATTWKHEFGFVNSSRQDIYIASFYWTIATMVAVGYGDIRATNNNERGFAILTMLAGGIMFGAVIAQVSRLVEGRNPEAKLFKEKMREIKAYLAEKSLPQNLKNRAKETYTYYLQKKTSFEANIMEGLARHLLIKLINNVYENEIRQIKLFRTSDPSFMTFLVTQAQPFQVTRGEVVLKEGDVSEDIIFIMRGLVRIHHFDSTKLKVVGYCEEGGYFGDFEYYKKSTRIVSYQAIINCSLFSISFKVLDAAIDTHYDAGRRFLVELKKRFDVCKRLFLSDVVVKSKIENSLNLRQPHRRRQLLVPTISKLFKKNEMDGAHPFDNEFVWIDGVMKNHDAVLAERKINRHLLGNSGDDSLYRLITPGPKGTPEQLREESLLTVGKTYLMIHPHGTIKKYWDFLIVILIVYSVLMIPVSIAFSINYLHSQQVWEAVVDVMFLFDLLFSIRTCYLSEHEDAWVLIPQKVWRKYASSWFLIDLLSSIPFDNLLSWILGNTIRAASSLRLVKMIRVTRIIKLFRLLKLSKYLSRIEDVLGIDPATFDFIKIILDVTFIAHLVACIWWGVCVNVSPMGTSWIDSPTMVNRDDLRSASTSDQYVLSLYWTFTTLATVGYGDITPLNSSEKILAIFVMMGGATVFGYIVANVATLIGTSNIAENQLNERISEITEYLREKNVPKRLSKAIVRHFKFTITKVSVFDEDAILGRFPRRIKTEIQLCLYREKMLNIPIFKFIRNPSVCLYIFNLMVPEFVDTDQFLAKQGAVGNEITFIVSGRVRVYQSSMPPDRQRLHRKRHDIVVPSSSTISNGWSQSEKSKDNEKVTVVKNCSSTRKDIFETNASSKLWVSAKPRSQFLEIGHTTRANPKDGDNDDDGILRDDIFDNDAHRMQNNRKYRIHSESESNFNLSTPSYDSVKNHSKDIDHSSSSSSEGSDADMEINSTEKELSKNNVTPRFSLSLFLHNILERFKDKYERNSQSKKSKSFCDQDEEDFRRKGRNYINELVSGDFFGYVALMNNGRHKASVRAIEPCNVYTLKREEIRRLLSEHPSIAFALQTSLSQAIYESSIDLDRVYIKKNRHRFASQIKKDYYEFKHMRFFNLYSTNSENNISNSLISAVALDRRTKPPARVILAPNTMVKKLHLHTRLARVLPISVKESKWESLRRVIADAKLQAKNAQARVQERSMIKDPKRDQIKNEYKFYLSANRESLFTLALKKKIGGDVEKILNEQSIDYDSDQNPADTLLHQSSKQYVNNKRRRRSYGINLLENIDQFQRFVNGDTGKISSDATFSSDAFGAQRSLIRVHRSTSDLLGLDMSFGRFSHDSAAQKVQHVLQRSRRNSFPSSDQKDWKIIRTKHIYV